MVDISKLDNPYVQVIWEDTPENFTQERIKRARTYFSKKYNTTNVNVVLKAIRGTEETQTTVVDTSFNILDKNYQLSLVKEILKSKELGESYDDIAKLDSTVENKLVLSQNDVTPFKKWYLKKIEFSNFLSYGEDQVLDYETINGLVVIQSDPPNFAGKSIISLDLPLFLFFNTTTRTTKVEEIFNKFTDKNKVSVKGTINIDGDDYIINRTMERKLNKSGEWNVKSELDFFKVLADGELQNFTGEQRRETEKFIKTSIGEQDDFLMTILTTGSNLESLLDSKPTARGQILSRFLGLDTIKKKEEAAKELYAEYSKGMLSNVFNVEELKNDIVEYEKSIVLLGDANRENNAKLIEVNDKIKVGEKYREDLINTKHTDIDKELIIFDPMKAGDEVKNYEKQKVQYQTDLTNLKVVEPSKFYHEDKHDAIRESITKKKTELAVNDSQLREIENLMSKYSNGITCEHCGIELINAAYTQQKVSKKNELIEIGNNLKIEITNLTQNELEFINLKKEFDEYEKAKLIKEKLQLNIEGVDLKIDGLKDKIRRYNDIQNKIADNNKIEVQLIKAKTRLDELTQERDRVNREISNNDYQISNYRSKIEENNKRIIKISEEYEKEKIYKIYLELYGKNGVSKQIMKSMIPMINSELQRLMEDSAYFNLEIRISDKNEVEFWMIDNSTAIEKLMITGSGYEKTIASLAIRSVLSKVCSLPKPNIIVFDEVFGKISDDNLEMVGEFFKKIKEYFDKVMIITHNPLISQWADSVIKVSKKDNISQIIMD
jgi:DNA repair exonuclease SbcCD ATPase subunit